MSFRRQGGLPSCRQVHLALRGGSLAPSDRILLGLGSSVGARWTAGLVGAGPVRSTGNVAGAQWFGNWAVDSTRVSC